MTLPAEIVEQVRRRANFACEYCGVTEVDAGGELTIDHYHPRALGGSDDLSNLLYCCYRCNLYKSDYWPSAPTAPALWNPRREPAEAHTQALDDGTLQPLTPTGTLTVRILRLNRPQLVARRLQERKRADDGRTIRELQKVLEMSAALQADQATVIERQNKLFERQLALLQLLLKGREQ
jgi:hypothetical protein